MKRYLVFLVLVPACGWDPSRPFHRDSPVVREAIDALDAGDAAAAATRLEEYLSTGPCKDGNIGAPDLLKKRADGTFDLGLSLFRMGEHYGKRFGEEEAEPPLDEATRSRRHGEVACARRVADVIAEGDGVPIELRARADYLAGNLAFLDADYEGAVRAYDRALVFVPGTADGGDPVGRDAAWNRGIALRRIEDKKDAGNDASRDASGDAPRDAAADSSGRDAARDATDDPKAPDAGRNDGNDADAEHDKDAAPQAPPDAGNDPPDAGAPPPRPTNEDERMLDQLENAPTLQQEEAKRFGKKRVHGTADK